MALFSKSDKSPLTPLYKGGQIEFSLASPPLKKGVRGI